MPSAMSGQLRCGSRQDTHHHTVNGTAVYTVNRMRPPSALCRSTFAMPTESATSNVATPMNTSAARLVFLALVRGTSHTSAWTMLSTMTSERVPRNQAYAASTSPVNRAQPDRWAALDTPRAVR